MSTFRFKQFSVTNDISPMKVNTDGVLLGAAMTILPTDRRLLDIGTGTGTIALMAAQRLSAIDGISGNDDVPGNAAPFSIDAIDIDAPSASEAAANFAASPWAPYLHAHHTALASFLTGTDTPETADAPDGADTPDGARSYDLIFSNPPYYDDSLLNPDARKSEARHTMSLSFRELLDWSAQHLAGNGRIAIILPADREHELLRYARMNALHPFHILRIRTTERKAPSRVIVEFAAHRTAVPDESLLTIHTKEGYSAEYLSLTSDFYL